MTYAQDVAQQLQSTLVRAAVYRRLAQPDNLQVVGDFAMLHKPLAPDIELLDRVRRVLYWTCTCVLYDFKEAWHPQDGISLVRQTWIYDWAEAREAVAPYYHNGYLQKYCDTAYNILHTTGQFWVDYHRPVGADALRRCCLYILLSSVGLSYRGQVVSQLLTSINQN